VRIEVQIPIQDMWGTENFRKDEWGAINYFVGPNGTGKSRLAEKLLQWLRNHGLRPRYLNSERLSGLEKQQYRFFGHTDMERGIDMSQMSQIKSSAIQYGLAADSLVRLKEKVDLRIRLEAILSQAFKRSIRLAEEGGFLRPKLQGTTAGGEYDLRTGECHGLKELVTLLPLLYDDEYDSIILDEPELHLHPQLQSYLMQEVRSLAGDPKTQPGKKCFFIVTHSPYCLELRTLDDVRNCIVFRHGKPPSFLGDLDSEDEYRLKKLLPRLNTHHKQFFFATRPIFVEGYTDQQLFTLIQERRDIPMGASGACFIDVGGKDEMDFFYRLCLKLGIDGRFVADLDTIFDGKLIPTVSIDPRSQRCLQDGGVQTNLDRTCGEIKTSLSKCVAEARSALGSMASPPPVLAGLVEAINNTDGEDAKRYAILLWAIFHRTEVDALLSTQSAEVSLALGRLDKARTACGEAGLLILPRGEMENHLPRLRAAAKILTKQSKDEAFAEERDFLLSDAATEHAVTARYEALVPTLDEAAGSLRIDLEAAINDQLQQWAFQVQRAFKRREVRDVDSLKAHPAIEWGTYSRLLDVEEFTAADKSFACRLKVKFTPEGCDPVVTFTAQDHPTDICLRHQARSEVTGKPDSP